MEREASTGWTQARWPDEIIPHLESGRVTSDIFPDQHPPGIADEPLVYPPKGSGGGNHGVLGREEQGEKALALAEP